MIFKNQTIDALFAVMISILMVMGAFTFTIVEDQINYFLTGSSVFSNEPGVPGSLETPSPILDDISNGTQTTPDITEIFTLEANATPDMVPTKKSDMETKISLAPECTIRNGWELYLIREGDTLDKLARARGVTPPILQIGNCLAGNELTSGEILYLPPMEGNNLSPTFPEGTGEAQPGLLNETPTP